MGLWLLLLIMLLRHIVHRHLSIIVGHRTDLLSRLLWRLLLLYGHLLRLNRHLLWLYGHLLRLNSHLLWLYGHLLWLLTRLCRLTTIHNRRLIWIHWWRCAIDRGRWCISCWRCSCSRCWRIRRLLSRTRHVHSGWNRRRRVCRSELLLLLAELWLGHHVWIRLLLLRLSVGHGDWRRGTVHSHHWLLAWGGIRHSTLGTHKSLRPHLILLLLHNILILVHLLWVHRLARILRLLLWRVALLLLGRIAWMNRLWLLLPVVRVGYWLCCRYRSFSRRYLAL